MTLLDGGIRDTFASVFGDIYEDATLRRVVIAYDTAGDLTETTTDYAAKAHAPSRNAAYRAGAGFADNEIEILVLQGGLAVTPTTDDRIQYKGVWYDVVSAFGDGAHSHWRLRARIRNTG